MFQRLFNSYQHVPHLDVVRRENVPSALCTFDFHHALKHEMPQHHRIMFTVLYNNMYFNACCCCTSTKQWHVLPCVLFSLHNNIDIFHVLLNSFGYFSNRFECVVCSTSFFISLAQHVGNMFRSSVLRICIWHSSCSMLSVHISNCTYFDSSAFRDLLSVRFCCCHHCANKILSSSIILLQISIPACTIVRGDNEFRHSSVQSSHIQTVSSIGEYNAVSYFSSPSSPIHRCWGFMLAELFTWQETSKTWSIVWILSRISSLERVFSRVWVSFQSRDKHGLWLHGHKWPPYLISSFPKVLVGKRRVFRSLVGSYKTISFSLPNPQRFNIRSRSSFRLKFPSWRYTLVCQFAWRCPHLPKTRVMRLN